jgi:hypothetical protein
MKLHIPSFVIGVAVGATGAALAPRVRPIALELATVGYRIADAAMLRVARGREDVADLFAEARARARARLRHDRVTMPTSAVS